MKVLVAISILFLGARALELNTRVLLKQMPLESTQESPPQPRALTQAKKRFVSIVANFYRQRLRKRARAMSASTLGSRPFTLRDSLQSTIEFRHKLNRRMAQTDLTSSGVYSSSIYTPASLNTIVSSTVSNPSASQASIIVINQPVPIGVNGYKSRQINEMCTWRTGPYPPQNGYLTGAMTIYEVEPMLSLLNLIQRMYAGYYDLLPDRANPFVFPRNQPPTAAVIKFYQKVKVFSDNFVANRDELQNDMLFSISRLLTFITGYERMMKFFDMWDNWDLLQQRAAPFEEYDPKYKALYTRMSDMRLKYDQLASALMSEAREYQRVYEYFDREVQGLVRVQNTDPVNDAVDKFNLFLSFIMKIQEMRGDLFKSIDIIKQKLGGLKSLMKDLAEINRRFADLILYSEQKQVQQMKESEEYLNKLRGRTGAATTLRGLCLAAGLAVVVGG